ncbi:MAG: nucleotide-binding enzyme [Myxococcota bacterium]
MSQRKARADQLRGLIAHEAARLMYEENVQQYFDAKRMASRRIVGRTGSRTLRFRPRDLPSNGEIQEALLQLAEMTEGHTRLARLFAMRVIALETMEALAIFKPRLIGSVSTGHVRRGSDIDLHVFTDILDPLENHLHGLGWAYDIQRVTIWKENRAQDYLHVHIVDSDFPIELSVYPTQDLRVTTRSSTNGKPIVRLKPSALRTLIAQQHPNDWETYQQTGQIPQLEEILALDDRVLTLSQVEALVEGETLEDL